MSFISVIAILLVSKLTIFLSDITEKICSFVVKMTFQEKVRPEVGPEVTRRNRKLLIIKFVLCAKVEQKFFEKYKTKILLLLVHWKLEVDSDSITTGKWR